MRVKIKAILNNLKTLTILLPPKLRIQKEGLFFIDLLYFPVLTFRYARKYQKGTNTPQAHKHVYRLLFSEYKQSARFHRTPGMLV
ncbi:hypothetical protein DU62_01510 [Methanosarcina mazei]|uniref:Uncharacterized protein n=1 Tax=Methanosarcina mazei TaxID=2209 RepID=A0A0F8MJ73_METMZ|nr:hypothetical protein DU34_05410 [Methanosarcina mazei]KKG75379.1 hypothetical protein DU46_02565 [Methanosarcina mazei]KKG86854.1 hypothetical protein DU61_19360 [Methanosarcina mazei]KKH05626.1 hypothetical protein DU51_01250 [Methanosarcina mazei]KKH13754.1 hypothetical protein DU62_01510 [Methanosarcina mazei]